MAHKEATGAQTSLLFAALNTMVRFWMHRRGATVIRHCIKSNDTAAIALVGLLTLAFFWPVWTPKAVDRLRFASGDFTEQYYPLRRFAAEELAQGRLPLWNPYIYAGQPALADAQSSVFYPLTWFAIAASRLQGRYTLGLLEAEVLAHVFLAGVFTYLFTRRLWSQRTAALAAAIVFAFGGYLTGFPLHQPTVLETATWLPLLLLCIDRATEGSFRLWALAALSWGLALLAGHPQTALYVGYTALVYAGYAGWRAGQGRGLLQMVLGTLAALLLGAGLAAIQLVPTWEFIQHSPRAVLSYEFASNGLRPQELLALWLPEHGGHPAAYVGVVSCWVIGAGWLIRRNRQDTSFALFWSAIGLGALWLALGRAGGLYWVFYHAVPGFALVRNQERVLLVFGFAAAMLTGLGVRVLAKDLTPELSSRLTRYRQAGLVGLALAGLAALPLYYRWWAGELRFGDWASRHVLSMVWGALGLLWLAWRLTHRQARPVVLLALLALLAFDLFSSNWRRPLARPSDPWPYPNTAITAFLQARTAEGGEPWRAATEGLLPGDGNAGIVYGFEDLVGNSPLHLADYAAFLETVSELRWWQLLNVRYVVTKRELTHGALGPVAQEGDLHLYQFWDGLSRGWMVHKAEIVPDQKSAWARLDAPDFNPAQTVVLEEKALNLTLPETSATGSRVRIMERSPSQLVAEVNAVAPGLVVFGEIWYPGWQAWVDGKRTPVYRANGILRAVPVEAGNHRVEMRFAPVSLRIGAAVSAIALLILALLWSKKLPTTKTRKK